MFTNNAGFKRLQTLADNWSGGLGSVLQGLKENDCQLLGGMTDGICDCFKAANSDPRFLQKLTSMVNALIQSGLSLEVLKRSHTFQSLVRFEALHDDMNYIFPLYQINNHSIDRLESDELRNAVALLLCIGQGKISTERAFDFTKNQQEQERLPIQALELLENKNLMSALSMIYQCSKIEFNAALLEKLKNNKKIILKIIMDTKEKDQDALSKIINELQTDSLTQEPKEPEKPVALVQNPDTKQVDESDKGNIGLSALPVTSQPSQLSKGSQNDDIGSSASHSGGEESKKNITVFNSKNSSQEIITDVCRACNFILDDNTKAESENSYGPLSELGATGKIPSVLSYKSNTFSSRSSKIALAAGLGLIAAGAVLAVLSLFALVGTGGLSSALSAAGFYASYKMIMAGILLAVGTGAFFLGEKVMLNNRAACKCTSFFGKKSAPAAAAVNDALVMSDNPPPYPIVPPLDLSRVSLADARGSDFIT